MEDRDAEADNKDTPAHDETATVQGTPGPKKKKLKVDSPTDEKKAADQLLDEATREAKKARKAEKAQKLQEKKAAKKAAAKEKKEKKNKEDKEDVTAPATTEDIEMTEPATETAEQTNNVPQADNESSTSSEPHSPTFDSSDALSQQATQAEAASTTTSVSSAVPPSDKPKHIKIPEDTTAFRERFAARLAALRAARKADGPDGKPIRSRQELLEQRRQKQAQRKEHKKEMRKVAKLEEERKREEALKANSPSVMSPGDEFDEGNFSFGRVAFGDGSQLSHDLSYVLNREHKKGPSDPKTALLKLQNQKKRLAELDEEKRKEIEEKETWLTARRRAEGEKIRDDEGLLKKAVKRKERTKRKSEKEWKDRKQAVESGIKQRQKKREENIRKRKEEKKLGKLGKKRGGVGAKKKNRPGFEGRFGGAGKK